jgi:hypothetical protein
MASKRKASAMASAAPEEPVDPADELMFLCLGGGNEVGRSCHIIQYKGKTVMVGCHHTPNTSTSSVVVVAADIDDPLHSLMPVSTQLTMGSLPSPSLTISISAR